MVPCFNWCWRKLLLGSVVIGQPEKDRVFDASSLVGTCQLMVVFCTPGVGGRLPTLINRSMPSWDASAAFNKRGYCFV